MYQNYIYTTDIAVDLQEKYGLSSRYKDNSNNATELGGGYFGVNSLNPQGGSFVKSSKAGTTMVYNKIHIGSMTNAIRGYNLSRNLYNLSNDYDFTPNIEPGIGISVYANKLKANNDLGFMVELSQQIHL
jgi:hypothetical protein